MNSPFWPKQKKRKKRLLRAWMWTKMVSSDAGNDFFFFFLADFFGVEKKEKIK
jgi:hypothetical protein